MRKADITPKNLDVDKNFKFDPTDESFIIDNVKLNLSTKQEDINLFGYEYYHDYQDKYIYTLKQRLVFKEVNFKVSVVFRGDKIWLIEIKHELDNLKDDSLFNKLYKDISLSNQVENIKVGIMSNDLLRIEFLN